MWVNKYEWDRVKERLKALENMQNKCIQSDSSFLNMDAQTGREDYPPISAMYFLNTTHKFPVTKPISLKTALGMVLDHLGLTLKCKESQPDQFVLEKVKK